MYVKKKQKNIATKVQIIYESTFTQSYIFYKNSAFWKMYSYVYIYIYKNINRINKIYVWFLGI